MAVQVTSADIRKDGRDICFFDISVPDMEMRLTNYGGIIMKLLVPDRDGNMVDVELGFDALEDYFTKSPYFGALIGRYANRIGGGRFEIDGTVYTLPVNSHGNTLHGGGNGFDKKVMDWEVVGENAVRLFYTSPDGENGFPGTLKLETTYALTDDHDLRITYRAETDKDTVVNLTNHSYFNLSGGGDILDHEVRINAERFTEVRPDAVPTGRLLDVEGTPLDFRERHAVGERIGEDYEQLRQLGGYDHNYELAGPEWCAEAWSPKTGILMRVVTTMPGVQFYSACNMGPIEHGKNDAVYEKFGALCFETQFYPDAPNHPAFPSALLRAGEVYEQETVFSFSTE